MINNKKMGVNKLTVPGRTLKLWWASNFLFHSKKGVWHHIRTSFTGSSTLNVLCYKIKKNRPTKYALETGRKPDFSIGPWLKEANCIYKDLFTANDDDWFCTKQHSKFYFNMLWVLLVMQMINSPKWSEIKIQVMTTNGIQKRSRCRFASIFYAEYPVKSIGKHSK